MSDEILVTVNFECVRCGGKRLELPDDPTDDSIVKCASCGNEFGRWGDIKNSAKNEIKEDFAQKLRQNLRDAFKDSKFIKFK